MTPPADRRWELVGDCGAFTRHIGEFYHTSDDLGPVEDIRFGFRVLDHHCNLGPVCHGGMLATFVDIALARGLRSVGRVDTPVPTISLSIDYLAPAPLGAWVDARVSLNRLAKSTGFVSAMLHADDVPVLRGSGIFRHFGKG